MIYCASSRSMSAPVEIPKRAFFKSAEVCAIAGVQPYVLKSWETEFPSLGGKKRKDGSRVYGRSEVELVLEIKELVYGEGLPLGAARRKLRTDDEPKEAPVETVVDEELSDDDREKLAGIKQGLKEILALLSDNGAGAVQEALQLGSDATGDAPRPAARTATRSGKATRADRTRAGSTKSKTAAKRKRRTA